LLTAGQYAQVFGALGAETALAVPPPDRAVLRDRGLLRARDSVVKIEGVATSCSRKIEGSGFVVAPHLVVTNAHVVAGVTEGPEVFTRSGAQFPARVVLFDPRRDVAVLDVPGLPARPLRLALAAAPFGGDAIVAGYPLAAPFTAVAARVGRDELAVGPDIYQTVQITRQIYPVRAVVRPGNSGGPLLSPGGRVYGMVFAAATSLPDTGYALTAAEIAPDVRRGEQHGATVSTGACQ
jgi:S1-C subfamily serine protease